MRGFFFWEKFEIVRRRGRILNPEDKKHACKPADQSR